jgi:hypothetical protein
MRAPFRSLRSAGPGGNHDPFGIMISQAGHLAGEYGNRPATPTLTIT